ncbi:MAG: FHA domain-containing protein [Candidatus Aminicenantes bacterium]|nr:MAG: FHA domain-containing protein [Candidatus Aminicenantes bacterium]
MKLKSLLSKLSGKKKKSPVVPPIEDTDEVIQQEISFDRRQTRIEEPGVVGEIDVYVNNEKMNIHTLAPVTKIGRDPSQSDIIISELIVSKLHCTIYSQGERFFIKDNHSTNGVYINHQQITEQEIKNGDMILLGKKGAVKLVFHIRK